MLIFLSLCLYYSLHLSNVTVGVLYNLVNLSLLVFWWASKKGLNIFWWIFVFSVTQRRVARIISRMVNSLVNCSGRQPGGSWVWSVHTWFLSSSRKADWKAKMIWDSCRGLEKGGVGLEGTGDRAWLWGRRRREGPRTSEGVWGGGWWRLGGCGTWRLGGRRRCAGD